MLLALVICAVEAPLSCTTAMLHRVATSVKAVEVLSMLSGSSNSLSAERRFIPRRCLGCILIPSLYSYKNLRIIGGESFLACESTLNAARSRVVKLTLDDSCLQLVSSLLLVGQHVLVRLPQVPRCRHMNTFFRVDRRLEQTCKSMFKYLSKVQLCIT